MITRHARDMLFPFSSRLRKLLAWLALCAMLMAAVAPTLSRWLNATAQAAAQVEVCGEHGVALVDVPPQALGPRPDRPSGHQYPPSAAWDDDCCPYCTLARLSPYVPVAAPVSALAAPLPAARALTADIPAPALPDRRTPQIAQAPPARA